MIMIIIIIILDSDAIFKISEGQAAQQNAEIAGFYVTVHNRSVICFSSANSLVAML